MTAASDPASEGAGSENGPSTAAGDEAIEKETPTGEEADIAASPAEQPDELAQLTKQRDDYLEALRRLQAEFENYKKRLARQQSDYEFRATESFIRDLLPVLDTLDLALEHEPSGPLEQVASSLRAVAASNGLERVDTAGTPFDPTIHDAVDHEHGEQPAEVVEILRSGYRLKDKVLRPAMVRVKGS